jgi:hypothetical protein
LSRLSIFAWLTALAWLLAVAWILAWGLGTSIAAV